MAVDGFEGPPNKVDYQPLGRIGGVVVSLIIVLSAVFGSTFIFGPVFPLMFLCPWAFRRIIELITSTWQTILMVSVEKFYGVRFRVTGDAIPRHRKTVILLNHRSRVDWLYFFYVIFHSGILNRHKIALKAILKWFPGVGWGMQAHGDIFLDRNWDTDQNHITRLLTYLMEHDSKLNILFFPEGTDLTEGTRKRCRAFAKKNDLPLFDYVLNPRVKGFTYFVNTLRNVSGIHAVHDATVAYPYGICEGEQEFVQGIVPKEVHFHLKEYSISELPEDEEELAEWVRQRWVEKEAMLKEYYSEQDPSKRRFKSDDEVEMIGRDRDLWLCAVFWISFIALSFYWLYMYAFARFYFFTMILFYFIAGFCFGGVEKLEMLLYEVMWKPFDKWAQHRQANQEAANFYDKYMPKKD